MCEWTTKQSVFGKEDNAPFFFWIKTLMRMTSKMISKTMTRRITKIPMVLANQFGILWPLSSANLFLIALLHSARREI